MNLRDFHYFLAVADSLNFKRAAETCHVSQPTLSMQIKKLEMELGLTLFERTNKSVMLTDAGRRVLPEARRMIDSENAIRDIARAVRDPRAGEFRLGAFPTIASYVFPALVPAIARCFPQMQLLLIEEKTGRLLDMLRDGKIDAAILALPIDDAGLDTTPVFDDPFFLAVGREHALAARAFVTVDDLAGHKLLLLDEGHCLRDQALEVCHAHGAHEDRGFRATSLETLRLMVRSDKSAMTLIPSVAIQRDDGLRYIPFQGTKPSRRIGLVRRKTSARAETVADMARLFADLYRKP